MRYRVTCVVCGEVGTTGWQQRGRDGQIVPQLFLCDKKHRRLYLCRPELKDCALEHIRSSHPEEVRIIEAPIVPAFRSWEEEEVLERAPYVHIPTWMYEQAVREGVFDMEGPIDREP